MNAISSFRQSRRDPFLIAILIGIVVLLLIAGGAVVFSRQPVPLLPADTPGGTVQRFYSALQQGDEATAYDLLSANLTDEFSRTQFIQHNLGIRSAQDGRPSQRIRLDPEQISGDVAVVIVKITYYSGNPDPFGGSNEWTVPETFHLERTPGTWRITELPVNYMP